MGNDKPPKKKTGKSSTKRNTRSTTEQKQAKRARINPESSHTVDSTESLSGSRIIIDESPDDSGTEKALKALDLIPSSLKFTDPNKSIIFDRQTGINCGRSVIFDNLPPFSAIEKLRDIGWDTFIKIDVPAYPISVRLFYANAVFNEMEDDITVKSFVYGKHVSLDVEKLNSILGMENTGEKYYVTGHWTDSEAWEDAKNIFLE